MLIKKNWQEKRRKRREDIPALGGEEKRRGVEDRRERNKGTLVFFI
jgi:hypothetical protein